MTKEEKRQSIKKELLGKYGIKTDRDLVKQLGIKDEDKSKLYLWIEYQRCFSYEEGYRNCIESENEMLKVDREWISVETKLPKFDELVIWRGLVTWNSKNPIRIFSDEMTMEQETLEYGEQAYLLKNETDYVVCRNPNVQEFTDQFVTHWMPLPQPPK